MGNRDDDGPSDVEEFTDGSLAPRPCHSLLCVGLPIAKRIYLRSADAIAGTDTGPHLTRYTMYERLRELGANLALPGSILSISHSEALAAVLGWHGKITNADWPEHDLLDLHFSDDSFDAIVSDQVIEHLYGSPLDAFRESARVVRAGGLVVHTTCFLNPVHASSASPHDLWRFSPEALRLLAEQAGMEVIVAEG